MLTVIPHDAAFFIAQRIRSNVRELEGALKRVIASAHFMGRDITIELIRESLKDLLALQALAERRCKMPVQDAVQVDRIALSPLACLLPTVGGRFIFHFCNK